MEQGRILVVEDEFLIRITLAELLEDAGHAVVTADSGKEALALLSGDAGISLMLTDMSLPGGMNGLALMEAARQVRADLPVMFVTGRPDLAPPVTGPGMAVVAKPYAGSDILACIDRLMPKAAV
jgi:CheY-like chemotaxis protein